MASNQYVNKVQYGSTTLIDLTGDDVTAADVLSGKKFHLPSGAQATGTYAGAGTKPTINIRETQFGSGDASLSNPRPIFPGMVVTAGGETILVGRGTLNCETGLLTITHSCLTADDYAFTKYSEDSDIVVFRSRTTITPNTTTDPGNVVRANIFSENIASGNPWRCATASNYTYWAIPASLGINTVEGFLTLLKEHSYIGVIKRKSARTVQLSAAELADLLS